jgi:hypothetical protein
MDELDLTLKYLHGVLSGIMLCLYHMEPSDEQLRVVALEWLGTCHSMIKDKSETWVLVWASRSLAGTCETLRSDPSARYLADKLERAFAVTFRNN